MLNEFEKYMKDNLESARSSWDKEALWQDIEKQLPNKKREWLPVVLIAGLIGFSLAYLGHTTLLERAGEQIVKKYAFYAADINANNAKETMFDNESAVEDINSSPSMNVMPSIDKDLNAAVQTELSSDAQIRTFDNLNSDQLTDPVAAGFSKANSNDFGITTVIEDEDSNTIFNDSETIETRELVSFMNSLPLLDRLIIQMESQDNLPFMPAISLQEIAQAPKARKRMALALMTGAGLTSRKLDAAANSDLLSVRENAEKQLENIFASTNLSYFFSNRFSIEMGFEWRQISERMNFTEMESSVESRYIDTAQYYTNFMGQLEYNGKEVDVITRRQRENVLYNRHIQFLMPIHVGYTHKVSRMGISLAAGPVISLIRNYKGARITENLGLEKSLDINTSGGSILHGFDVGLNASLDVGAHYALMMGLNYRKALTSYSIDNIGNQSYDLLDARLGLLIHLN